MNPSQTLDPEPLPLEDQLVGINAKTAPYPAARSWSGGRRRILGKGPLDAYCYHVMSRTCGGDVFFDDVEKEALRRLLWKMSEFSGLRLVTYCIMGNHFHALVEVPRKDIWIERFSGPQGELRLFDHLRTLYSKAFVALLRQELDDLRKRGLDVVALAKIEAIKRRFCDLSLFVKEVKERFSRWFNKRRGRKGTLWMDRFKSVMVEGRGEPLHTMAAYIDLNPVRAGLVEDPKDYRWCGYGEAMGGSRRAQRGLARVTGSRLENWLITNSHPAGAPAEPAEEAGATPDEAGNPDPAPVSTIFSETSVHVKPQATRQESSEQTPDSAFSKVSNLAAPGSGQLHDEARQEIPSHNATHEASSIEVPLPEVPEGWTEAYRCLLFSSGVEVKKKDARHSVL
jgi:putative transposase